MTAGLRVARESVASSRPLLLGTKEPGILVPGPYVPSPCFLDSPPLRRPATVVRHRRHIADGAYFNPRRCQSANGRLAARTRTGDPHIHRAQPVIASHAGSVRRCLLRRERRAFARTAESQRTRALPAQRVAHRIGDGDNGVVECGLHVRNAERNILAFALFELLVLSCLARRGGLACSGFLFWFGH